MSNPLHAANSAIDLPEMAHLAKPFEGGFFYCGFVEGHLEESLLTTFRFFVSPLQLRLHLLHTKSARPLDMRIGSSSW